MTNNGLIKILKTLSRKEMTRFREFVRSPYFNKHEGVIALIDYLNKIFPDFNDKKCNRQIIHNHLYPEQAHDQAKLALLFTYSFRRLEKFLVTEGWANDDFQSKMFLLKQLRQRGLHFLYEKTLPDFDKKHPPGGKGLDYQSQYQLAFEKDRYFSQLQPRKHSHYIEDKQRYLDYFFLTDKLRDACEMTLRSKILKLNFEVSLVEKALREVSEKIEKYRSVPPIIVYAEIYKMLDSGDLTHYNEVIKELKPHEDWFDKTELQNIYNYLQNFCIEQINKGEQRFLNELFKIYQSQLEKELILVDGYLPEWHYKNIVTTGLRLKEHDWVRRFLDDYKPRLKPRVVENAYSYNLATYYYYTRQYEKVLDLLVRVEYTDIRYNLDAKSLLLRTYYDLEEEEALFSLTDAFRQFLKRNRLIPEFQKKGYYNLIKFARRAFLIKTNMSFVSRQKSKEDLDKLKREIELAETVFNRSWLEGKVRELVGRAAP